MSAAASRISTLTAKLDQIIDEAVAGRIVGTNVLISHNGDLVYQRTAGLADREAGVPMLENAIFRLASLTKPMVSATALALVERGQIDLDDAVTKWIPEFQPALPGGGQPKISIRQLLNHTAGLGYGFWEAEDGPYHRAGVSDGLDQPGLSMEENLRRIASVPLAYEPGASWSYSVSSDVAGEVIARVCGCSLPEAVSRFVTRPLAMSDTGFFVTDESRLVVPYADGSKGPVRMGDLQVVEFGIGPGSIRFAPSRAFDERSFPSGGCGMAGTAEEFSRFLEAIRTGGGPILSAESTAAMTTNQTGEVGPRPGVVFGFGLSVIVNPAEAATPQSAGTFAWGGVYGHSWFVDPAKRLTVVSLTNTTVAGMRQFPADIRDAIYETY